MTYWNNLKVNTPLLTAKRVVIQPNGRWSNPFKSTQSLKRRRNNESHGALWYRLIGLRVIVLHSSHSENNILNQIAGLVFN